MIDQIVTYINNKLTDINVNYGLCEKVTIDERSVVKQLGENGAIIDFAKVSSCSYILPNGTVTAEEIDGDVGGGYVQRLTYPVNLVIFKERCELPELDEIYQVSQKIVTNNDPTLVSDSGALQGAKIQMTEALHDKTEIFERDFSENEMRFKLSQIMISLTLDIILDLDLECDNIKSC